MSEKSVMLRRKMALMGATAILAGLASTANAQTVAATAAPAATTEQVEVTGTRIQNSNANSANPITVITAKEIEQTNAQTIEDVLQKDVSFGSSGLYGTTNNGGNGLSCTDIRNLGITRVLVLVDGQRFVHGSDGAEDCVDLNNIPLQMVDHIDILKDGASSTYGADAVSGVINIVLKKNFTGNTVYLSGELPTSRGGSNGEISDTMGANFDRGNITINLDYLQRAPVSQGDRNWSNRIVGDTKPAAISTSGFVPYGQVIGLNDSNDQLAHPNGTFTPFTNSDRFNFAPFQDLVGGLEKESATFEGHYDINDYVTVYLNSFFTHKYTTEQLAPEPIYAAGGSAVLPQLFVVPFGAPGNTGILPGSAAGQNLLLLQRALQLGPREYDQTTDTFQTNFGFKGVLPGDIDYDTYYNYGVSDDRDQTFNSANVFKYEQLVGYQYNVNDAFGGLDGTFNPALCPANIGCQNFTNLSPAAVNYIRYTDTQTQSFTLRTYGLDLSKKDVVELPAGGVGLAFGFDHREEHGEVNPDNLVQTGETNETATQPTNGGFNVNEVYGEANIPILADLPFAKRLSVDVSGRYFSYNTFGSGETWKATANYEPVSDIRFRGDIGTAFRQPTVSDLYGGQYGSADAVSDPCLIQPGASTPYYDTFNPSQAAIAAANCKADGVKSGTNQLNTQITTLQGGNPKLLPETARNIDLGVVIKPHWIKNFNITVDYWRTKIENTIGAIGPQTSVDQCYQSVGETSPLCSNLGAGAVPGQQPGAIGVSRNSLGQFVELQATNENTGVTRTSGIDAGFTWNVPIGDYGAISEDNEFAYVINYYTQNYTNGPFIDYNGTIFDGLNGNGYPRFRDNNTLTWINGPLSLSWTARFISGMNFENNTGPTVRVSKTGDVCYHDLDLTYEYKQATIDVGINNVLGSNPPFVPDNTTNTAPAVYDVVGRVVYAHLTYHF